MVVCDGFSKTVLKFKRNKPENDEMKFVSICIIIKYRINLKISIKFLFLLMTKKRRINAKLVAKPSVNPIM
jgi:hypothetical protein